MRRLIVAMAVALAVAGCVATAADVRGRKDRGVAREYPVGLETAWEAVEAVASWRGAVSIDIDREDGVLLGRVGHVGGPPGYVFALWVERVTESSSRVTALIRGDNFGAGFLDEGLHEDLAEAVSILTSGQPLRKVR